MRRDSIPLITDTNITYTEAAIAILKQSSALFPFQLIRIGSYFLNSVMLANSPPADQDTAAATLLILTFDDLTALSLAPLGFLPNVIGHMNNADNRKKIGNVVQGGWLLALSCSIPQMVLAANSQPILALFGQEKKLTKIAGDFFKISMLSVPLNSLQAVSDNLAMVTNHNRLLISSQTLGVGAGFLFAYPLIFGKWGASSLGMNAIAWSYLVRVSFIASIFSGYTYWSLKNNKTFSRYHLFDFNKKEVISIFKFLCKKGLPIFGLSLSEVGVTFVLNMMIGQLGESSLGAQLVISQYQDFMMLPIATFAAATSFHISQIFGSDIDVQIKKNNIIKYANASMLLSLTLPALFAILCLSHPRALMSVFIDPNHEDAKETLKLLETDKLLFVCAINIMLNGIKNVYQQSAMGIHLTTIPLLINTLGSWVGVGTGFGLAYAANLGFLGLSLGMSSGYLMSAIAQVIYWNYQAPPIIVNHKPNENDSSAPATSDETSFINPNSVNAATNARRPTLNYNLHAALQVALISDYDETTRLSRINYANTDQNTTNTNQNTSNNNSSTETAIIINEDDFTVPQNTLIFSNTNGKIGSTLRPLIASNSGPHRQYPTKKRCVIQ